MRVSEKGWWKMTTEHSWKEHANGASFVIDKCVCCGVLRHSRKLQGGGHYVAFELPRSVFVQKEPPCEVSNEPT